MDLNLLDAEKDRDFIIVRVLERGTDLEIGLIESVYSQREIIFGTGEDHGSIEKDH